MKLSFKGQWMKLWDLFWSFLKISPVTFGGGYAMIPAIEHEAVITRNWLTEAEMSEAISISGSSPGGIGVNAAAFIGYRVLGMRGLIAAVLGIMLPTFVIVLILGIFFVSMRDNPKIIAALQGIQIAVIALIAFAGLRMSRTAIYDKTTWVLFILGFVCLLILGLHPVWLIPIGILSGLMSVRLKELLGFAVAFENKQIPPPKPTTLHPKFPDYFFGEGI